MTGALFGLVVMPLAILILAFRLAFKDRGKR
jgi:hypothetical protein